MFAAQTSVSAILVLVPEAETIDQGQLWGISLAFRRRRASTWHSVGKPFISVPGIGRVVISLSGCLGLCVVFTANPQLSYHKFPTCKAATRLPPPCMGHSVAVMVRGRVGEWIFVNANQEHSVRFFYMRHSAHKLIP